MKVIQNTVLGFDQDVEVPSTLAELVEKVGSEEGVLDLAISYVIFHKHNSNSRKSIVEFLESKHGVKRLTEEKDGKTVIIEKDMPFVGRVRTELGDEVIDADNDEIRVLNKNVDWTPGRGGSGTVGKQWLAYYDELKSKERLEEFCEKENIDMAQDEEIVKVQVAVAARRIVEAKRKEADASILG